MLAALSVVLDGYVGLGAVSGDEIALIPTGGSLHVRRTEEHDRGAVHSRGWATLYKLTTSIAVTRRHQRIPVESAHTCSNPPMESLRPWFEYTSKVAKFPCHSEMRGSFTICLSPSGRLIVASPPSM